MKFLSRGWMLLVGLGATTAFSWGPEGHRAVGLLAKPLLTPATQSALSTILAGEDIGDLTVVCWADFIRRNKGMKRIYPDNDRWHYLDLNVNTPATNYQLSADGNDVVSQVERWKDVLADPQVDAVHKRDAARFLIHFVADMHQPLHCADRDEDRGGNLVSVHSFRGEHFTVEAETSTEGRPNLHRTWDDYLIIEAMAGGDLTNFVTTLAAGITPDQIKAWSHGTPKSWAWEAHELAVSDVYRLTDGTPVPTTGEVRRLDLNLTNYISRTVVIPGEQLQKAGVRLARLLNDALDAKAGAAP
jgi:hypothetical protein